MLIYTSLAVGAIAAGAAALICFLDMVVNNYGECVISINGGKRELKVKGGAPLLTTLAREKIFIPSACGGRGSCGACKVKVVSDVGPHLPTEIPYLDKEEIAGNIRLSCQIKIKKDIEIDIPDKLFNVKELNGKIEKIVDVTHDIKEVLVDLGGGETDFTAGMYMQFEAPAYNKIKSPTQRAYSISSVPSAKNKVEFLIRLVPGGIVTTYVHTLLKEGDRIRLIGPFGEFERQDTDAIMICVGGGSGMAPFKSIFYDMFERNLTDREVWYFFGARTESDLYYVEELTKLEEKWPSFHFVPALSEPSEGYAGPSGIITAILDSYLKEKIDTSKPKEGYLCGSPGMIAACNDVMTKNGISLEKIYYDKFA